MQLARRVQALQDIGPASVVAGLGEAAVRLIVDDFSPAEHGQILELFVDTVQREYARLRGGRPS